MNDIDQTALEIARAFIPVDVVGQQRANLQVAIIEAIKKHANPKNLADVQPGGRVRLGDALPGAVAQALAIVNEAANDARHAGNYKVANALVTARITLSKQLLALSAQPSPGGQDAPEIEQVQKLVSSILSTVSLGHQTGPYAYAGEDFGRYLSEAAGDCRKIMRLLSDLAARQPVRIYGCCAQLEGELHTAECPNMRHLAVRQPVGEPVAFMVRWKPEGGFGLEWPKNMQYFRDRADEYEIVPLQRGDVPAQAVDLGQFRELYERWSAADPHPKATARGAMVACAMELLALLDSQAVGK